LIKLRGENLLIKSLFKRFERGIEGNVTVEVLSSRNRREKEDRR
jgi:hypothetical protein